jgi:hypothetical protein
MVDDLVLTAHIALLVGDIQSVTADEPDTKHNALHA